MNNGQWGMGGICRNDGCGSNMGGALNGCGSNMGGVCTVDNLLTHVDLTLP
mgnify:CR=1 FL=1|jgi:hypothetical protein